MKASHLTVGAVALLTALSAGREAAAQSLIHQGFMARLSLGIGYLSASESGSAGDLTISGLTGTMNLALGVFVVPNLALHGTVWGGSAINPEVSVGSVSATTANVTLTAVGLGVGATYFFQPFDVYASASIGASVVEAERVSGLVTVRAQTGTGWGLNLLVGRQFALSPTFGLGGAFQVSYQSNPDRSSSGASYALSTLHASLMGTLSFH